MYRSLQLPHITASKTTSLELVRGGAAIFAMTMAVAVQPFVNANILYKMASPRWSAGLAQPGSLPVR